MAELYDQDQEAKDSPVGGAVAGVIFWAMAVLFGLIVGGVATGMVLWLVDVLA